MANLNGFDADEVEPSAPMEAIPSGVYLCVITESEMKENKKGTGEYLQLTFEVVNGDFKGRKVWARLNLNNDSETAVQIARQDLSAICLAVGKPRPKDSEELHDLPLLVKVVKKKRQDTGEDTNECKSFMARDYQAGGQTSGTAKPPAKTPPAGDAPWKKKS